MKTLITGRNALALTALAGLLVLPDVALAQLGGGGGGQLNGLLQWFVSNIIVIALNAGILAIALLMMLLRVQFQFVAAVAVGGLIAANYTTIAGFFPI